MPGVWWLRSLQAVRGITGTVLGGNQTTVTVLMLFRESGSVALTRFQKDAIVLVVNAVPEALLSELFIESLVYQITPVASRYTKNNQKKVPLIASLRA